MQKAVEGKCRGCGALVVIKKDVRGHDYYHCQSCKETRFWYSGIQVCGDYVKPTIAKNGFRVGYCARHGAKVFRLLKRDVWDREIKEDMMLL
jgi:hypothetical protein